MDVREKTREMVEELIDEELLTEMNEQDWKKFDEYFEDCVHELESLAIYIEEYILEKLEKAEPQFDTLGEARGER